MSAGRTPCFSNISVLKYSERVDDTNGGCRGPLTKECVRDRFAYEAASEEGRDKQRNREQRIDMVLKGNPSLGARNFKFT